MLDTRAGDGVARVQLRRLAKAFGGTRALDDVSVEVGPGEILGVTGPSGPGGRPCAGWCGVEAASAGDLLIDGTPMTEVPPERRRVEVMFSPMRCIRVSAASRTCPFRSGRPAHRGYREPS